MVMHDHKALPETGLCESGCVFRELRDGRVAEENAFFPLSSQRILALY